ncbi:peptide chain release factor N(5)-glutamine methyltransferase [Longirhabdus pacifica]|uniref:peptide chain release factor N(5)-glutamine methyltransferase n=1 Tax=Longirhabdus pacifica TaxID=2305227 RepID=UPI001008A528|nr:peptide chain release factor N(5)-glutamine methyltransferase [Longirhabdus pacifica]
MNRNMTIFEAYQEASSFLTQKEIGQDVKNVCLIMLQHVLSVDHSTLLLRWHDPFPAQQLAQWQQMVQRKAKGEPVQYIVGEQHFYGLPFHVTQDVLIPRPETELLVEHILQMSELQPSHKKWCAVDIGTGSGAIAVTLAYERPNWNVCASDLSSSALQIAQRNAKHHNVNHIAWAEGDLLQPWIEKKQHIDILISNPPYIPTEDVKQLQVEVVMHEPGSALDGGEDGLDFYRTLVKQLEQLPTYPNVIGFEVGIGQADDVAELLRSTGTYEVEIIKDYNEIERHVIGLSTSWVS